MAREAIWLPFAPGKRGERGRWQNRLLRALESWSDHDDGPSRVGFVWRCDSIEATNESPPPFEVNWNGAAMDYSITDAIVASGVLGVHVTDA
jgi:hypothetical protein